MLTVSFFQYQTKTEPVLATAEVIALNWFAPLSEPVRKKPGVPVGQQQYLALGPLPQVSFSWFAGLAEPVRKKPGLAASLQQYLALNSLPQVSFSWFNNLSIPQKLQRIGFSSVYQQTLAFNPQPVVSFGWFGNLSEPVRVRPSLKTGLQAFSFYVANPTTVTPFAWFANLSEPVRVKPGLKAPLQQFFTTDPTVIPVGRIMPWYAPFSEPVRIKLGLLASSQQFYTGPVQLRPNASITVALNALETKDTFLGAIQFWNTVVSGEVGVIEMSFTGAEIGAVTTRPSAGTSGTVVTVEAGTGGSAVPVITRAGISIRIL